MRAILELKTIAELKKMIRETNIRGYSKLNKKQIIDKMMKEDKRFMDYVMKSHKQQQKENAKKDVKKTPVKKLKPKEKKPEPKKETKYYTIIGMGYEKGDLRKGRVLRVYNKDKVKDKNPIKVDYLSNKWNELDKKFNMVYFTRTELQRKIEDEVFREKSRQKEKKPEPKKENKPIDLKAEGARFFKLFMMKNLNLDNDKLEEYKKLQKKLNLLDDDINDFKRIRQRHKERPNEKPEIQLKDVMKVIRKMNKK